MNQLLDEVVGPLAAPECKRSLNRRWVRAVRPLAAVPPAAALLAVVWYYWLYQQVSPGAVPEGVMQVGLKAQAVMFTLAALLLSPALLAGSIAGERLRGTLSMLLTCQVTVAEILLARLLGRLAIIAMFLLAALPLIVLLGTLATLPLPGQAMVLIVPLAVAFGGGGMSLAASVIARRGRDALLAVYLAEAAVLLAAWLSSRWSSVAWLAPLDPFHGIAPLIDAGELQPACLTSAFWLTLGLVGLFWAAWRLRPAYLHESSGARTRTARRAIPPVSDRPLIWKELYIEQLRSFNRLVQAIGIMAIVVLLGVNLVLAVLIAAGLSPWSRSWGVTPGLADWATAQLAGWTAATSTAASWLIQWALGLRAAVAIPSERERSTWDALLTSPLEGTEIVLGKIYGSLYALRGFVAAVVVAWVVALICGAMTLPRFFHLLGDTLIIGVFMVVLGVWLSLASASATKAMSLTIVGWLIAALAAPVLAILGTALLSMVGVSLWFVWLALSGDWNATVTNLAGLWPWLSIVYTLIRLSAYLLAAMLIAQYCWRRFDRLAGRATPHPFPSRSNVAGKSQ